MSGSSNRASTFPSGMQAPNQIGYSGDGRTLAGIGTSGRLGVFDLATRRMVFLFETDATNSGRVALSSDGRVLVANDGSGVLHSWEIKDRRDRFAMPEAHADSVYSILCTPDGKTVITASEDKTIRLWDRATGRQNRVLKHPSGVKMMALSRDGRWLIAPESVFGQVYIWDLQGGASSILSCRQGNLAASWPLAVRLVDNDKRSCCLPVQENCMMGSPGTPSPGCGAASIHGSGSSTGAFLPKP